MNKVGRHVNAYLALTGGLRDLLVKIENLATLKLWLLLLAKFSLVILQLFLISSVGVIDLLINSNSFLSVKAIKDLTMTTMTFV